VFRRVAEELLEMDDFWPLADHRVGEHVHPEMEERWLVVAGAVGFRIDGQERIAGPGERVTAPAGVPHMSWNAGGIPVHLRIQMSPALRWAEFVERLFALPPAEAGGPDQERLLKLMREFPREIALR